MIDVADGATLTIDALFTDTAGDLDIKSCDDLLVDCGVNGSAFESSTSGTDDENATVTNTTGGTVTYYIEMYCWGLGGSGSATSSTVTEGNITPGPTRYDQRWCRDPGGVSPCGTGSNFSRGRQVDWF